MADETSSVVDRVHVGAHTIPTDRPESDGTLEWEQTTIVLVQLHCGPHWGLGYTYGPRAVETLIERTLCAIVRGSDPLAVDETWEEMHAALRNAGQAGIGAMALSAVDIALHDLRARMLGGSLAQSLGRGNAGSGGGSSGGSGGVVRERVPIYGSGGFTSYTLEEIAEQLSGWVAQGIGRVKIKVGRHPEQDGDRLAAAREAIGDDVALMVDANGAFEPDSAVQAARGYAEYGVDYFEEPVSSDDVAGLAHVRRHAPDGMAIAAGEYSWSHFDTLRLLDAEAVDIVQADVTRCGGITELLRIDELCAERGIPLSLHCAPAISAHVGCALRQLVHLEYFHDHVRIEDTLFDGAPPVVGGELVPDLGRAGAGLVLREANLGQLARRRG